MTTREALIEDDSAFLKVPEDEIPPVRQAPVEPQPVAPSAQAAKVTGAPAAPLSAPSSTAPRQIPGLAFRAAHGEGAGRATSAPPKKDTA